MSQSPTATFAVSSIELAMLCSAVGTQPPAGFDADPLAGMTEAQMSQAWESARDSLAERGLAATRSSADLDIDETLAIAVSLSGRPDAILRLRSAHAKEVQSVYVYLTGHLAVWHTLAEQGQHYLGLIPLDTARSLLATELLSWTTEAEDFAPLLISAELLRDLADHEQAAAPPTAGIDAVIGDALIAAIRAPGGVRLDSAVSSRSGILQLTIVLVRSITGDGFLLTRSENDPYPTFRVCAATEARIESALTGLLMGTALEASNA